MARTPGRHRGNRSCASYSTPFILEGDKGPELIVASTAGVASYNPSDGSENWNYVMTFATHPLRTVASPISADGLVIANAGEGGAGRHLGRCGPAARAT